MTNPQPKTLHLRGALLALGCGALFALTGLAGCARPQAATTQATPAPTPTSSAASSASPASSTRTFEVGELLREASHLVDQPVKVRGRVAGFRGACREAPPVSRSDWMLDDSSGTTPARCLYVHGRTALAGADAMLELEATLRQSPQGHYYLQWSRP